MTTYARSGPSFSFNYGIITVIRSFNHLIRGRMYTDAQICPWNYSHRCSPLSSCLHYFLVLYLGNIDEAFILLYKEMYYRHMMANPKMHQLMTVEQRVASFNTYTELFNHLLSTSHSFERTNCYL